MIDIVFLIFAAILFIGFFGELIFRKTNIPDIILLIIVGVLIGSVLKWISPGAMDPVAPFFTTFALIFLLFEAGINIDIKKFFRSASKGFKLSVLSFVLSFFGVFLTGLLLGRELFPSLLLGTILSGISSAVVLPLIENLKIKEETKLSLIFDSAFSDVLCILGTVTLIEIIVVQSINGISIVSQLMHSFLVAIAIGIIMGIVWIKLLVNTIQEHKFMLTMATMLSVYSISELLDANGAIGALVFGLLIGNSKRLSEAFSKKKTADTITKSGKEFYSEVAFMVKAFFFVYLGTLIDFSNVWSFLMAGVIIMVLYLIRPFAVWLTFDNETPLMDVKLLETMIPKGLAAAVLVQLPIQAGIPGAEGLVNIVLAVVLLSITFTSIFVMIISNKKYPGVLTFLYKKYRRRKKVN